MGNEVHIEIQGVDMLLAGMKEVRKQVREGIIEALSNAAHGIEEGAVKNLKANGSVRTGTLISSFPGNTSIDTTELTAVAGTDVVYAPYLEYGTTRQKAKPYFNPAVEDVRPKYLSDLKKAIGK